SRNTVELAYHQLIAEGYIQSRPRSGLFVIQLEHEKLPAPSPVRSKSFQLSKHDRPVVQYDFRYGDVAVSHFPVSTWRKL
ncbi:PLP-dependent aminotransferase family protein, partial [Paenibacillus sp. UMB4589-SE434]|nr:PLP-dependent aminotransferase family protein [Paenibacillus sp. UMB4589-SE434]